MNTYDVEFYGYRRGKIYDLEFLSLCEGKGREIADEIRYGMARLL